MGSEIGKKLGLGGLAAEALVVLVRDLSREQKYFQAEIAKIQLLHCVKCR